MQSKVSTGIEGLDDILAGGLPHNRLYLIEGSPGTGKTTIALQFLLEGVRLGERVLYVTLSETISELRDVADSHGWTLDGVDLYELKETDDRLRPEQDYTVFHPEDVELTETVEQVYRTVEETKPARAVFDSLSEMRLLARDPLRFRRQILRLKNFFAGCNCTVLLLDDKSDAAQDLQLQTISHGVIALDRLGQEYGVSRRRLNVVKLRGSTFRDGFHDFALERGGIRVFPRLVAAEHRHNRPRALLSTGLAQLDSLLGGGITQGTSVLMMGPAGLGKTTIGAMCLRAASQRGERSCCYLFEENRSVLLDRMAAVNLDLQPFLENGTLKIRQVDPAELSPREFASQIRRDVEEDGARIVMIDSVTSYLMAMPSERFLLVQMHEMLSYLAEQGVVTLLVLAQSGNIGQVASPVDMSYLGDTLILFRYFEAEGSVRKAISVLKSRSSMPEPTLREIQITAEGIALSAPLRQFTGVLTGVPYLNGDDDGPSGRKNG